MPSNPPKRNPGGLTFQSGLDTIRERRYQGFATQHGAQNLVTPGGEIFYHFEKTARIWLIALNDYTDEQFARKPSETQWSIGQVYYHLVVRTENFHLRACQKCLENRAEVTEGGKTLAGKIVFLLGSFPPVKIHVPPPPEYTPKQPQSRAEMREGLLKLIETMRTLAPQIDHASPVQKWKHPALGMLNANEWYRLIEMHFRHHLRQKARLDKFLARQN
ncbi:MAG: DinB family protein [bacterium]